MPKAQLRERIQELLTELEGIEAKELAARDQLASVLREIREAIESSEDSASSATESLIERLNETTRQFEKSHPTLTAMVGRVADSLANLGI
jgi:predicted  nucleic acid-binding Zn-ribbon protein